jgi:hypothetical protein
MMPTDRSPKVGKRKKNVMWQETYRRFCHISKLSILGNLALRAIDTVHLGSTSERQPMSEAYRYILNSSTED